MGGDDFLDLRRLPANSFNPRPRMGGDKPRAVILFKSCVSIHAPAWGATLEERHEAHDKDVSIHAPAWGATTLFRPHIEQFYVSIHAPAWGATNYKV